MTAQTIALALIALFAGCSVDDAQPQDGAAPADAAHAPADGAHPDGPAARPDLALPAGDAGALPDAAGLPDAAMFPDAALLPDAGGGAAVHDFPRLGAYYIGGSQKYDAAFQTWAARFHVHILGGQWEGWETGRGYTKEDVIAGIKKQSQVDTKVFLYVNLNEEQLTRAANPFPHWFDQVQAQNWWCYLKGSAGAKAQSTFNNTWGVTDMTAAAARDQATGLGPYGWGAKFVDDFFHLGKWAGTSAAPSLDGFFLDNMFMKPRAVGDWDRDGVTDSNDDAQIGLEFRTGEKEFYDYLAKAWPGSVQLGNAGDDFGAQVEAGGSVAPLAGAFGGGVFEGGIGKSWSVEHWGGAAKMMTWYHTAMQSVVAPKYMIFGHDNVHTDGSDPTAFDNSGAPTTYSPAWQGVRYGLAAVLMDDGYYFADATYDADTADHRLWFDEFDAGGIGVGYLGQPIDPPQVKAWSNGIWKREFAHGIVLWSPKGAGKQTVSLNGLGNLKRIQGTQDQAVNSGAQVTNGSVTLQDRDGLILVRY